MKNIIISDIHIGQISDSFIEKNSLERSINETFSQLDNIIDLAIKNKTRLFINGDVFEEKNPTALYYKMFIERLKKLDENKVETHIISGNHDKSMSGISAITPVSKMNFNYIFVYDDIESKIIGDINYIFVPHITKGQIGLKDNEDVMEKIHNYIKDKLLECIDNKKTNIVMSHIHYKGAVTGAEDRNIKGGINFFPSVNTRKIKYVFLGHIHKYQIIEMNNTTIYYTGSIVRNDFSECDEKKVFLIFDDETLEVKTKKIDTTEYKVLLLDFEKEGFSFVPDQEKYKDCQDKIIKIKIRINEDERKKINLEDIEKFFSKFCFVAKKEIEVIKKDKEKIEFTSYNPVDLFNNYIDKNVKDAVTKKWIKEKGKNIILEEME